MKRLSTIAVLSCAIMLFSFGAMHAQLSGTKTIPGDYATIALAVADLNSVGVGFGGVTFNVAAGHTEPITSQITIALPTSATAGTPIVFQKSGGGANPLITRTDAGTNATSTLGGLGDGIIQFSGTDYITFNGIDLAASDQGIEYGYYFHKPSGTDGCQNVTIQNCTVTMTKGTSAYVIGIYVGNGASAVGSATGVVVTAASGVNRDVTIIGNTISNVHAGVVCRGATAMYDTTITIGQSGAGNTIQNFGGGSATTTYGVYFIYVTHPNVSYNTINNAGGGGVAHGSTLYGVFYSTVTGNVVGSNNAITMANSSASSATQYLYNGNTVTSEAYNNNTFAAGTLSSTGTVYLIYSSNSTLSKTISGNSNTAISRTGASGTFYCYYNNGSPGSGTETYSGNTFSNITLAGTSTFYGYISTTASGHNQAVFNNTISSITGGSGTTYGLHMTIANRNVYNNTVQSLAGTGVVYGISNGSGLANIYQNSVYNLSTTSTATTAGLVSGILISASGTNTSVYNNFISDLRATTATGTDAIRGISITGTSTSSTIGLYYNTIYLTGTGGATFGSSGVFHTYSATSTTASLDMRNNIIVNNCTPAGTAFVVGLRRSSATSLANYATTSNNNAIYVNTGAGVQRYFYAQGTTAADCDSTIGAFKTRVSPREAASFSELPPFVNVGATPYNLHMNTGIATQTESGGTPVTTPIAVAVDYDGDSRNASTPDVGADEFAGVGLDLSAPGITYTPFANASTTGARTLTSTITDASGVPTAGIGLPVLYWRINSGSYSAATGSFVSGNQYTFTFGGAAAFGDTVYYYICAQDNAGTPNVGASPSGGAGGFSSNPPAASTPPTTPSSYRVLLALAGGDYTIGTSVFNRITGRNITHEIRTRRVMREIPLPSPTMPNVKGATETEESVVGIVNAKPTISNAPGMQLIEVEEQYGVLMENGHPYDGPRSVEITPEVRREFGLSELAVAAYTTITAAVSDLNARGVSGAVQFLLVDATYPSETFPIIIAVSGDSVPTATKTITIRPNTGVTPTVSGSSATGIFVSYSPYVIFDGDNVGGGTSRDLTINNTAATANSYVVGLFNSPGFIPINNTIKNCNIKAGISGTTVAWGIVLNAAGGDFDNVLIDNNAITKVRTGIQFAGVTGATSDNGVISNNIIGSVVDSLSCYFQGILVSFADNTTITNNEIIGQVTGNTTGATGTATSSKAGVSIINSSTNTKIRKNTIHDFFYNGTTGYGSMGIVYGPGATTNSGITEISNNFIYNIKGDGDEDSTTSATSMGFLPQGICIYSNGTAPVRIYHNTIHLSGNVLRPNFNGMSACIGVSDTVGAGSIDIRNNILRNSMTRTTTSHPDSGRTMGIWVAGRPSPTAVFSNLDDNDYVADGNAPRLGFWDNTFADLEPWRTKTSGEANGDTAGVEFASTTDLHLAGTSIGNQRLKGTPTLGITDDIDGQARDIVAPYVGADESSPALPIQLASFTAHVTQNGSGVLLNWTTASEINNYGFYVERRRANEMVFVEVPNSFIAGHGTTGEPQEYSFVDNTLPAAGEYHYRLRQVDLDGTRHWSDPINIQFGVTSILETAPREFALFQNYPNPFNPETVVKFSVENTGRATLDVYNVLGQKVATLFNDVAEAGQYYNVRLNGANFASGLYIYKLQSGVRVDVKKMMLLK